MIHSIPLLITLTSCVSAGSSAGDVTQTCYQAEENHNVTLEWTFPSLASRPPDSFTIYCQVFTEVTDPVLFYLRDGVEVSKLQDERFAGRVRRDGDVFRERRLRLHVSGLRTDDSGDYHCQVIVHQDVSYSERCLNVTWMRDRPEPEESKATSRERMGLLLALGPAVAVLILFLCLLWPQRPSCVLLW